MQFTAGQKELIMCSYVFIVREQEQHGVILIEARYKSRVIWDVSTPDQTVEIRWCRTRRSNHVQQQRISEKSQKI